MKREETIRIGRRIVGGGNPVFIIAEAGVNHNGSLRMAKKLVDAAKATGADAVKFQTYCTEELVTPTAPKADYQRRRVPVLSQYQMLKRYELTEKDFVSLKAYCVRKKIIFLSSPFDLSSARLLKRLGAVAFKLGSGELTNAPLIREIAGYQKPLVLSTGMATFMEVKQAVGWFYAAGGRQLALLHCTSNYPARCTDVNLAAMETLRKAFRVPIGYSDHTLGYEISLGAVAQGASVLEKHLTLDKGLSGPDHQASLNPAEFRSMVQKVRNLEIARGNGVKKPTDSELPVMRMARKSVVSLCDISRGSRIGAGMLGIKRPGTGIPPNDLKKVIGRVAKRGIHQGRVIAWEDLV